MRSGAAAVPLTELTDIRYLEENATPEWKRAYIDYRGAKKAIKRAVASRESQAVDEINDLSSEDEDNGPSAKPKTPTSPGGSALSRIISGSPKTPNTARAQKTPRTAPSPLSPRPGQPGKTNFPKSPGASGTKVRGRGSKDSPERRVEGSARDGRQGMGGVTDDQPSPGYGATGTSPPLDDNGVQFPPPLDLGEPEIPSSPDLKSTAPSSSSSGFLEPSDLNKQRLKGHIDSARGSGFSPNVTSIPETPVPEAPEQDEGRGTSSEGGPSSPDTPTTPLTHSSSHRKHGHVKGSPSKFSFKGPKTHASVGTSPASLADAPSRRKSLREFRARLRHLLHV